MVHKYKRKTPIKPPIDEDLLEAVINQINNKEISIRHGAKQLNMPESTLRHWMKNRIRNKRGPPTTLPQQVEEKLAYLLSVKAKWGIALGREELKDMVKEYILENKNKDTEIGRQLAKMCRFKVSS